MIVTELFVTDCPGEIYTR